MKRLLPLLFAVATFAAAAHAQSPVVSRVADDARVIDRVAEASRRDLPSDLLRRIINEDIDVLRGKRADGTFQYAGYERLEAGRNSESYSVQAKKDNELSRLEVKGSLVYRLILESPSRRIVVTKNRRVYVDHVEIELMPLTSNTTRVQSVKIGAWIDPGTAKPVELDEIARQATVRVFAHADNELGYGNLTLTLVQAKIFDDPQSPYADAVSSEKAILKAIDNNDIGSIRAMASRVGDDLRTVGVPARVPAPVAAVASIDVIPPRVPSSASPSSAASADAPGYAELQEIEDLLTGNDAERRQGLDRLHQLVRKLRPR